MRLNRTCDEEKVRVPVASRAPQFRVAGVLQPDHTPCALSLAQNVQVAKSHRGAGAHQSSAQAIRRCRANCLARPLQCAHRPRVPASSQSPSCGDEHDGSRPASGCVMGRDRWTAMRRCARRTRQCRSELVALRRSEMASGPTPSPSPVGRSRPLRWRCSAHCCVHLRAAVISPTPDRLAASTVVGGSRAPAVQRALAR
jgi:hypothetical protein